MSEPPTAVNVDSTSITLLWNAWGVNPLDSGEGPVIAYKVYEVSGLVESITVPVLDPTSSPISVVVEPLTHETVYRFYTTCVRDGEGGEGSPSQFTTVTTLPGTIPTIPQRQTTTSVPIATTQQAPTLPTMKSPTATMTTRVRSMTSSRSTAAPVTDTDTGKQICYKELWITEREKTEHLLMIWLYLVSGPVLQVTSTE